MKRKSLVLIFFCQAFLLACSPTSTSTPALTSSSSPIPSPSATLEAASPAATSLPTLEPTPTPNSIISAFDSQAAGVGTPFPRSNVPITKDNLGDLELLAEWGRGLLRKVTYSADGQTIIISTNKSVFLHDRSNLKSEPEKLETNGVGVLSPDGLMLAIETQISIIATGEILYEYNPPPDKIPYIPSRFSPDGHYFVYRNFAGVKVIDLQTSEEIIFNGAQRIDFSSDGRTIALARGMEGVELYNLDIGESISMITPFQENEEQKYPDYKPVTSLAFSPDGDTLAVGYQPGEYATSKNTINVFEVFDVTTGEFIYGIENFGAQIGGYPNRHRCDEPPYSTEPFGPSGARKIVFLPNGEMIAAIIGSVDLWTDSYFYGATLYLFRASDGYLLRKVSNSVIDFDFSPDGNDFTLLLSTGDVQEWRVRDISIENEITGYDGEVRDIKLSKDENIIGIQYFNDVRLVDFHTGEPVAEYTALDISFSPDDLYFALAYSLGNIEIRQINDQTLVTTLLGHDGGITDVKFLPSGQLASSASNCTAYLWSIPDGQRLYQFEDYIGPGGIVEETRFAVGELFVLEESEQLYGSFGEGYIEWDTSNGEITKTFVVRDIYDERPSDLFHPFLNTFRKRVVSTIDGEIDINAGTGYYVLSAVYIDFYDTTTERQVFTLPAHTRTISKLLITSDGSILVSASRDGTIRIWGIPTP